MKNKCSDILSTEQSKEAKCLVDEIIKEINSVRLYPEKYLDKIQTWRKHIKPKYNILQINDKQLIINDIEQCFEELMQYLSFVKSMPKFKPYDPLFNSTDEFINVISNHPYNEENLTKNVVDFEKRLRKNGILHGLIAECIEYGLDDAETIVLKFLLDEKNDKMDRSILFNSNLKYIGVSCYVLNSEVTVSVLNLSEHQMLKKDKLIINLNKKLVYERMGKKNDSAKDYIYKMKQHNCLSQFKKKNSQSISTTTSTSLLKNFSTNSPSNNNNFRFKDFLNKDNLAGNPTNKNNIQVNNKKAIKNSESANNSLSNIKDLKISSETLDKAPNILKRLMSPNQGDVNFKLNTKIVNINLVENDENNRIRDPTPGNSRKGSKLSSPIRTIRGGDDTTTSKKSNAVNITLNTSTNQKNISISEVSNINMDESVSEKINLKNLKYYNNAEQKKSTSIKSLKTGNRNSNNMSVLSSNKTNLTNFSSISTSLRKKSETKLKESLNISPSLRFDDKNEFDKEIYENKSIVCINVNKRRVVDSKGIESFVVKKTVYYENGSTDEWIFKD